MGNCKFLIWEGFKRPGTAADGAKAGGEKRGRIQLSPYNACTVFVSIPEQ